MTKEDYKKLVKKHTPKEPKRVCKKNCVNRNLSMIK